MATESPIRIIEARGKWPPRNEMAAFGNLLGVEDLGLALKGQRFHEQKSTAAPNRSGSAPPSMEGSFAAIENLMFRHRFVTNAGFAGPNEPEPEEELRADPSYFAYYWAHVNLNPRLPPPILSSENRHLMGTSGNNQRFTSFDDSCDSSLRLDRSSLSTHKEESDDDRSPVNNQRENDVSISGITESQVAGIRNGVAAVNFSGSPKVESQTHQTDQDQQQRTAFQVPVALGQSQTYVGSNPFHQSPTGFPSEVQPILQSSGFTPPLYAADPTYMMSANPVYPNMMPPGYFPQPYTVGGYGFNPTPVSPYATGYLPTMPTSPSFIGQSQSPGVNFQNFNKFYGPIPPPFAEPFHEQKQQSLGTMARFNVNPRRVDVTSPYYFEGPRSMDFVQFPNSPFASPAVPGSPIGGGGFSGPRNEMRSPTTGPKPYSFLEELKSGKGRRLELSDVYGHVVEFSADQHGSRFIQQKLEACGPEEKESVFKEVLPHASRLITDVFGNYVIQKFFEYGSADQRRELGNQLEGQMLAFSLQMYGCRVIQKALDAIDLEKKIQLVHELDGHVLRCVRDQNGNHVIQKCIEGIPTDKIKFVISSFRGQVAALSTHPYGCRVIQRVLEHSTDEPHCQFIVDEILESVYALAQDQYGNYVTQHVLERGRPEERNEIIRKLAGRIVQLSQHKFASNVIEKCLEYGDSPSREIMIEEIIGVDDGSDNFLAMVKDQFANYVVQKVLQTCTGDQRELLLGRIKDHLDSLKKYTYGKHIVARFEQLYGEEMQASGS